ncbi:hypothetical protein CYLTODRAFT_262459 [Cylindrobasidium torrendii FP15055 ss-10]|uniref:Uncharacterized protein n=1 Tax=Cylindrobasidium torrendii FP15055 ss-10 TaxID=1314674 RepID=A0A0D7BDR4_9AGAR|nr:hypothetical protein CYLTODRAFT_262459 [Cylindrobasidium torrendii FP15055 ss-10]
MRQRTRLMGITLSTRPTMRKDDTSPRTFTTIMDPLPPLSSSRSPLRAFILSLTILTLLLRHTPTTTRAVMLAGSRRVTCMRHHLNTLAHWLDPHTALLLRTKSLLCRSSKTAPLIFSGVNTQQGCQRQPSPT